MFVGLAGAVDVAVAQADQLVAGDVRAGAGLPRAVEAAMQELGLDAGQFPAGQGPGEQTLFAGRAVGQMAEHRGERLVVEVQHQADRDRPAVFLLEEIHQVKVLPQ